jgi:stearoyl-CoA desaturase (delta-9 desaturase)
MPSDFERKSVTIVNRQLQSIQKLFGYAAVFLPALGTVIALVLLAYQPLDKVSVGLCILLYVATVLGITVGFHRILSHCSVKANGPVRAVFAVLGSMAAQGHVIHWVSNHRRHHQHTDQAGDPHSPHSTSEGKHLGHWQGFWHSHITWMFEGEFPNVLLSKDLLKDPIILQINRFYLGWVLLGFAAPAAISGLLNQSWWGVAHGLLWGGFVRTFLVHHIIWSINSVTHLYGRRPFSTKENSTNNVWIALPSGGESWHNNHHAFPQSAKFGLMWWQADIGWWCIQLMCQFGWVWDVKVPTKKMMQAKRHPAKVSSHYG